MASRHRVSTATSATLATIGFVTTTGVVRAHEIADSRFDAPIPLSLLFGGAAVTVGLTALWLGLADDVESNSPHTAAAGTPDGNPTKYGANARTPTGATGGEAPSTGVESARPGRSLLDVPPTFARWLRYGARVSFLGVVCTAVLVGLFGPQAGAENPATAFVWAIWLKGVGIWAILFGSPWQTVSPWGTLYEGLCRLEGREIAPFEYPSWLGRWPALVGFAVWIGVLENLTVVPRSPRASAVVVVVYAAAMVLGALAFGRAWLRNADALAILYRLFGRVAPLRARRVEGGYRIEFRAPWTGCTRPVADLSLVAFAVAAVYTVSFDGFTSTPEFQSVLFDAQDAIGVGPGVSALLYCLGLAGFVVVFLAASWTMGAILGADERWHGLALAFAPTLLPIAAAYELAHNYPFVGESLGGAVAQSLSIATGSAIGPVALLGWLTLPVFWGSQVMLIVGGHVIAVVAAHRVALGRAETATRARRMHLPLVVLMIGYTVLSLWIVSRPVVSW